MGKQVGLIERLKDFAEELHCVIVFYAKNGSGKGYVASRGFVKGFIGRKAAISIDIEKTISEYEEVREDEKVVLKVFGKKITLTKDEEEILKDVAQGSHPTNIPNNFISEELEELCQEIKDMRG